MRDLVSVIDSLIEVVPEDSKELRNELNKRRDSVMCAAPELMSMWWTEVYNDLFEHCYFQYMEDYKDWHINVWSIFTGKPIDQLKQEMKEQLS